MKLLILVFINLIILCLSECPLYMNSDCNGCLDTNLYYDEEKKDCIAPQKYIEGCILLKSKDVCSACSDTYQLSEGKCVKKPKYCKTFNAQENVCEDCFVGHGLKDGKCVECSKNCVRCKFEEGNEICTVCGYGSIENNKCIANKQLFDGCSHTYTTLSLESGKIESQCAYCDEDYAVTSVNFCVKTDIDNCVALSDDKKSCIECSEGYVADNGKCVKCSEKFGNECTRCHENSCMKCEHSDYYVKEGKCVEGKTKHCNMYNTNGLCSMCDEGYTLTKDKCEECPEGCKTCDPTTKFCLTCSEPESYKKNAVHRILDNDKCLVVFSGAEKMTLLLVIAFIVLFF